MAIACAARAVAASPAATATRRRHVSGHPRNACSDAAREGSARIVACWQLFHFAHFTEHGAARIGPDTESLKRHAGMLQDCKPGFVSGIVPDRPSAELACATNVSSLEATSR
jgi:hypothetical protein